MSTTTPTTTETAMIAGVIESLEQSIEGQKKTGNQKDCRRLPGHKKQKEEVKVRVELT